MSEQEIFCLDCGESTAYYIAKNGTVLTGCAEEMVELERFLNAHETTRDATHRLIFVKSSDVGAEHLRAPVSPEVARAFDA
jgi:hypothetical protein